jgi:hypothetical protein
MLFCCFLVNLEFSNDLIFNCYVVITFILILLTIYSCVRKFFVYVFCSSLSTMHVTCSILVTLTLLLPANGTIDYTATQIDGTPNGPKAV